MLKCNSCKNPVSVTSIHCEWCGAKIIRKEQNKVESNGKNPDSSLTDFMNKLNEVENEIIKENDGAGTWGALDGILTRAFGNSKIDSLNQKKATIIQTYPLPKNPDDLLEIANMAVSNFKNMKVNKVALTDNARNENKINKPIKDAWRTKTEQALNLLTIYSRTDDFIRQQIELLKSQLVEEKKGWF
jgi:DNA-directed RNA polymerase subunit RPC12/RpoP